MIPIFRWALVRERLEQLRRAWSSRHAPTPPGRTDRGQTGRERAHDAHQPNPLGHEGQREAEREAEHQEHPVLARAPGEPDNRPREDMTQPDRDPEEEHCLEENPGDPRN